jgi:hypothetical protein
VDSDKLVKTQSVGGLFGCHEAFDFLLQCRMLLSKLRTAIQKFFARYASTAKAATLRTDDTDSEQPLAPYARRTLPLGCLVDTPDIGTLAGDPQNAEIVFGSASSPLLACSRMGGGFLGAHSAGQIALISPWRPSTCSRRDAEAIRECMAPVVAESALAIAGAVMPFNTRPTASRSLIVSLLKFSRFKGGITLP